MADPDSSRELQLHLGIADKHAPRRPAFAFYAWARSVLFAYPERARLMLERAGSPAEAYFIRRLFESSETIAEEDGTAICRGVEIRAQVLCEPYVIDFVAARERHRLAIEIDGWFHRESKQQIAADYRRERFLLRAGYIVIRFTADEVMRKATDCWRDVFSVLNTQRRAAA